MKTFGLLICITSATLFLLSGCGLKKDIYLPEADNTKVAKADEHK